MNTILLPFKSFESLPHLIRYTRIDKQTCWNMNTLDISTLHNFWADTHTGALNWYWEALIRTMVTAYNIFRTFGQKNDVRRCSENRIFVTKQLSNKKNFELKNFRNIEPV